MKTMRGYTKLNECEKNVCDNFIKEFLKTNDSRIEFVAVAKKSGYLRVDLKINGRTGWLHVTPYNWY